MRAIAVHTGKLELEDWSTTVIGDHTLLIDQMLFCYLLGIFMQFIHMWLCT